MPNVAQLAEVRFRCDDERWVNGHPVAMSTRLLLMTVVVCSCGPAPAVMPRDAGELHLTPDDAGIDGGVDAGAGACSGSGACSALSAAQCQFGLALGCVGVRSTSCSQRGQCTGAAAQQSSTACRAAGACVWDGGCAFDLACPSRTTQQACLAASCTWVDQVTSCTGTWRCSALLADGGSAATCEAFSSATGFACR